MKQLALIETKNLLRQITQEDRLFEPVSEGFKLQYATPNGFLYQGNAFSWLESLNDASADLIFADPPHITLKKPIGIILIAKKNILNGLLNG